jgi:hypothetical protein
MRCASSVSSGQILGSARPDAEPQGGHGDHGCGDGGQNAKAGQVQYRTDKGGIIHSTIGRASFDADKLAINLKALVDALIKAKPATSKGQYVRRVAVVQHDGSGRARGRVDAVELAGFGPCLAWLRQGTLLGCRRAHAPCRQIVKDRRCDGRLPGGLSVQAACVDGVPEKDFAATDLRLCCQPLIKVAVGAASSRMCRVLT